MIQKYSATSHSNFFSYSLLSQISSTLHVKYSRTSFLNGRHIFSSSSDRKIEFKIDRVKHRVKMFKYVRSQETHQPIPFWLIKF